VKRLRFILIIIGGLLFFGVGPASAQTGPRLMHVSVALAENVHQGIVPLAAALGNGDDPGRNPYWDAAFGVRTLFRRVLNGKKLPRCEIRIHVCWNGPSLCIGREGRIWWPTPIAVAISSKRLRISTDLQRGPGPNKCYPDRGMKEGAVSVYVSAESVCGARWVDGLYDREQISGRKAVPA
jgi:hypothetical protein